MHTFETRDAARAYARRFEERLPLERRKQLGQFFTGVPLGKLLAHLALSSDTRSVLDPMAGHGDLLDATAEAAKERDISLERLDAIELDDSTAKVCTDRLKAIAGAAQTRTINGSAFDRRVIARLPRRSYDLVITNPPYVRYQSHGKAIHQASSRDGLKAVIKERLNEPDHTVWSALTAGYSGLADLSVPAWLLASALVRPGGRLALVVPATWRSREYGDVIRYLLLRCFQIEYIVEDAQPGWFSDALVRTQLVVARRSAPELVSIRLGLRTNWPSAQWVTVSQNAASANSLVGSAFTVALPEMAFTDFVTSSASAGKRGIETRSFDLAGEFSALDRRARIRDWYRELEGANAAALPLFASPSLPQPFREIFGESVGEKRLVTLAEAGIAVGQGLRTGCNRFFYVDMCSGLSGRTSRVRASGVFGNREFVVPTRALLPVLRRQSELSVIANGEVPTGRVLDLRRYVLPEDRKAIEDAKAIFRASTESVPHVMPDELASYVRQAAATTVSDASDDRRIPDLSAVKTNVRDQRRGAVTPRFWYMLPDFTPRHMPAVFVARINHETPWVERNLDNPILIDANFSTLWASDERWTPAALKALLNSIWCRVFMEEVGTTLGGGALKLEAAHLRQILIPALSPADRRKLDAEGRGLKPGMTDSLARIDRIVFGALAVAPTRTRTLAPALAERVDVLRWRRQKRAV